jgi:transposase, IS6 family
VTASLTIVGYEVMAMIRKGKVATAPANDMRAQSDLLAFVFSAAA